MTYWVESWPHKSKDLRMDPWHPYKMLATVVRTCSPHTGEAETRGSQELLVSQQSGSPNQ